MFLGRISYSFYVINVPILLFFYQIMTNLGWFGHGLLAQAILGVATTLCSIPLSVLCYHWVERPGIRLGKRIYPALARLLGGRSEPAATAPTVEPRRF